MIKQLMVALDGSDQTETVVSYGCDLARVHGARLIGLAPVDKGDIDRAYHTPRPLGAGSADAEHYHKSLDEAREYADSALKTFEKICKQKKVEHKGVKVEGDPADEILKAASLNDMLVMSKRTRFTCGLSEDEFCDATMRVLGHAARPFLLVPPEHRKIKKVMISVDFHRLSDRLLFTYVHMNPVPGAEIHLVHATASREKEFPQELIDYFKVHDLEVKPKVLFGEHVGQAIVTYAESSDIDMIVMGVHNVSKVWSVLLGNTGRYVLENLELPIFTIT